MSRNNPLNAGEKPPSAKSLQCVRCEGGIPSETEAEARLNAEGYRSFRWHDVSGAKYPRHQHARAECIWVIEGEIEFHVNGEHFLLKPGDRLYLPSNLPHTAHVPGAKGAVYLVGEKTETDPARKS